MVVRILKAFEYFLLGVYVAAYYILLLYFILSIFKNGCNLISSVVMFLSGFGLSTVLLLVLMFTCARLGYIFSIREVRR